jgi:hypothetical protein
VNLCRGSNDPRRDVQQGILLLHVLLLHPAPPAAMIISSSGALRSLKG